MTRQVDLKALVSHIVKGDGMDKCRICMGDTSQGQVHLGDTVMMDGNHPVTLSELLEIITGVEVKMDDTLPSAMCLPCYMSTYEAAQFRTLVQKAYEQWMVTLQLLEHLPDRQYSNTYEKITAVLNNNDMTINIEHSIPEKIPNIVFKRYGKQKTCECPDCGIKFMYSQHLYKHLKESADLKRACHICAEIMTRDELIIHLNDKHSMKPYYCKKCPALFLFNKQYNDHMAVAHAPGACTCGDCGRTFKSSPAYCAHISIHTNRSCPNCDKQFRNQKCYFYHIKSCCNLDPKMNKNIKSKITVTLKNKQNRKLKIGKRGSTTKKCICDYCKKVFSGKKFVAAHIQIVHTKNTHKPCEYCGKVFAAAHMTTHMKIHNAHVFRCQQCGALLKSKLGFVQHLRLHTGERPYPCQHCGQSFSASSRRSEHIRTMHLESSAILKHACNLCPAKFKLPYKLRHHIISVHGEGAKDHAIYECRECNEKFASCRSLLHHSKKHK